MSKVKFSIITPTYNRVKSGYLLNNVLSLQSQKEDEFEYEHIIVDDGSTDETKTLIAREMKKDSRIRYFYQKNSGPAKATQYGISKAKGDWIIILDDDDMLTSDSLKLRANAISKNSGASFFYGRAEWVDDYGLPTNAEFASVDSGDFLYEKMLVDNCIHAGTPTVAAAVIKKVRWPKWLTRSQDYFLWLEILRPENNIKPLYIEEPLVLYRFHGGAYTAGMVGDDKFDLRAKMNEKIRSAHEKHRLYLADYARHVAIDSEKNNQYRLTEIDARDKKIEELFETLNYYKMSRVVRIVLKLRNVIRGQILDRIDRLIHRVRKIFTKSRIDLPVEYTKNIEYIDRPLVSIVTPLYNRSTSVPETIRSVLGQTFQDFEYIIVDDGSTDKQTVRYLDKLSHPKITVIRKENGGVASARNAGVSATKGKYVMCLDDDDIIHPTFIEKAVILMESKQDVSIVTYHMKMFGKKNMLFKHSEYDPIELIEDNPIITSSLYRREVWDKVGGYKKDIGYEDWEFWVSAAEEGYFAETIPETLFRYRTAESSRYVEDLQKHDLNLSVIKKLHPHYRHNVKTQLKNKHERTYTIPKQTMLNLQRNEQYAVISEKPHILIVVPWLPFGGAEMYSFNFLSQLTDKYDYTIITGVKDEHVWDEKFQAITPRIYHLSNLYPNSDYYYWFIRNYIKTRNINAIHVIHAGYLFPSLERIKDEFPNLSVIVTMFNDRVDEYVEGVRKNSIHIDSLVSDNQAAIDGITQGKLDINTVVIPSGIDCQVKFNPEEYDRKSIRDQLSIKPDETVIIFAGRLSEEKNPDVFIRAMNEVTKKLSVRALIIGDGPMKKECEELMGSNERIIYLGYQDNVAQYLAASDIFVLPSSIEGFPLSILEAMSMRLAVVASRVGAIPEVIINDQNGIVVTPGSKNEIVKAVAHLIGDVKLLEKIKKLNRKIALEHYSGDKPAAAYDKLYKKVIK